MEGRTLLAASVPGMLSLADADSGQAVRVGNNPLSGGPFLGWTRARQRISYLIDVQQTGQFTLFVQAATNVNRASVHFEVDGINLTGIVKIPSTHGWYNWESVSPAAPLELLSGMHVLTMVVEARTANFQSATLSIVPFTAGAIPSTNGVVLGPLAPGAATSGSPAAPLSGNWKLAFSDEFNGPTLASTWTPHQYWASGATAGEGIEESDPANVGQSGGTLQLTARIDNAFGTRYTGALVQAGGVASDSSQPRFSFLYGYAEARILIPAGAGLWPAFWMLPASHNDSNGEIDVMEAYGANPNVVTGTVHRFGAQQQHDFRASTPLSAGWHNFAVDWESDHLTWYVDGIAYGTTTDKRLIPTEPMFPIFDLAVGGTNNPPAASTPFPATMQVDYVRIWQKQ